MRPLLFALALLWASAALFAQPADSLPARPPADTLFVIPAGPVAGSFTPAARIAVLDTIAGWAHITVEGWVPAAAVADRMKAAAPAIAPAPATGEGKSASRQCAAITKKGTRCKRKAEAGSIYCWQHRPK
jgi:hypothetical protein